MYPRAYLLLEREFRELKQNNYEGITALFVSEDMMKWKVEIEGLQNSIWHGLVSHLTITFTLEYNLAPPVVKFTTIPFHPNVNPYTGQPCIDFLDDPSKWNTSYTLSSILLAIQVMLSNPTLEKPVNLEAAQMLSKDESLYRAVVQRLSHRSSQYATVAAPFLMVKSISSQLAKHEKEFSNNSSCLKEWRRPDCERDSPGTFQQSLQLASVNQKVTGDNLELLKDPYKLLRATKTVSFKDYYKTWSGIATSKASEYYRTPLLEDPSFIGQYYKWKKTDLQYSKEWKFKYTVTKSRLTRENQILHKVSSSVERNHLCPTPNELPTKSQTDVIKVHGVEELWETGASLDSNDSDESWEEEVDNLVAWTSALDVEYLEN